jgi:uncharacterized membrane protein
MLAVIDASIDATWRVLADIPRQPAWMTDLKTVSVTTPGPVGVGTRAEGTVRILGITIADPVEITEFEPPTRFAIRHAGSFQGRGTIELEPGADGTTTIVRWTETLVPPVLPDLAAALQGPVLRRVFQDDLLRLKALVEAEAGEASAPEADAGEAGSGAAERRAAAAAHPLEDDTAPAPA